MAAGVAIVWDIREEAQMEAKRCPMDMRMETCPLMMKDEMCPWSDTAALIGVFPV